MNMRQRGKCIYAFQDKAGWHTCMAPRLMGKEKEHRHRTAHDSPKVNDVVAIRGEGNDPGYKIVGTVGKITKSGRVIMTDGKEV